LNDIVFMKVNQIQILIILGIISILGIMSVQVYLLKTTHELKEQQFNENIYSALHNVVDKMSPESVSNEDIINQLTSDYFVVNVNDVIDANVLEYYLSNEFQKLQLELNFEYGIYDCKSDQMMYGCYVNNQHNKEVLQSTDLETYNEYIYYFGVKFPTKSSYIWNEMRMSIFFTSILFFTIILFGYALFFILQQKRRSELQTDFINNMTHEFKTPIASIGLASEVLIKNEYIKEDKRLLNYSKIIKEQNERLNLQVEKVLQLAKDQNNLLELKKEELDISNLITTVVRSSGLNYEKLGGFIELNMPDEKVMVTADRLHLTNILHNILDNSLKYSTEQPIVAINLYQANNKVYLRIKDNGIGIDKKYQSQIFDKFYRVPTGNVHTVKGFGLGLFYVKKVIDQHGWKLSIHSEKNKGTEFTIKMKK
jgi:two-component system phosphate regulon sensor histidine kinase PhoR